jgi:hypothetical protein
MKKFLAFLLSLLMVFSLVACTPDTPETTEPDTNISTEVASETDIPDINADAILILEEMIGERVGGSDFIDVVLAYVPDVFMLQEYRCACWTYFLVMSDGMEYIVITDYDGKITSISEWFPETDQVGVELYSDPVEE